MKQGIYVEVMWLLKSFFFAPSNCHISDTNTEEQRRFCSVFLSYFRSTTPHSIPVGHYTHVMWICKKMRLLSVWFVNCIPSICARLRFLLEASWLFRTVHRVKSVKICLFSLIVILLKPSISHLFRMTSPPSSLLIFYHLLISGCRFCWCWCFYMC